MCKRGENGVHGKTDVCCVGKSEDPLNSLNLTPLFWRNMTIEKEEYF
jgi:hypothetical protein